MNANINQYPGTNGFSSPPKDAVDTTAFSFAILNHKVRYPVTSKVLGLFQVVILMDQYICGCTLDLSEFQL